MCSRSLNISNEWYIVLTDCRKLLIKIIYLLLLFCTKYDAIVRKIQKIYWKYLSYKISIFVIAKSS